MQRKMAKFKTKRNHLYIDGKLVIRAWESYTGWYWFAVEKIEEGITVIDGKEVEDTIWFGLVQGQEEEWGYFSEAELTALGKTKVWSIPQKDLPYSGRRN